MPSNGPLQQTRKSLTPTPPGDSVDRVADEKSQPKKQAPLNSSERYELLGQLTAPGNVCVQRD